MSDHDNRRSKQRKHAGIDDEETSWRLRSLLLPFTNELEADPAQAQHPTPETSRTPSTTPSSNGTDLPLPQSGSSGSEARGTQRREQPSAAELISMLAQTLLIPSAPPLHDLDPTVVLRWVEAASEALEFRWERRRLVRDVLRVLEQEWATAEQTKRLIDQIATREAERMEREDGTYWARRERGRAAQQATRVDVTPDAWDAAKAFARKSSISLGVYVGELVSKSVANSTGPSIRRLVGARRERLFVRIAVEKDEWAEFVARSGRARVTVSRYLGVLVESAHGDAA